MLQLIERAKTFPTNRAIISNGQSFSYQKLLDASEKIAGLLLGKESDLNGQRVAFLVNPGFDYVRIQWGIWRAGGIAVPLCVHHPLPSIQYVLEDTAASIVIIGPEYATLMQPLTQAADFRCFYVADLNLNRPAKLPEIAQQRDAMILYTSGTTNRPKGVVSTHATLEAQIQTLVQAWEWTAEDHILSVLPLHHVHGIVNVGCCALWSGATVSYLPAFDAARVFDYFLKGQINVFMAVPTIYYKLIQYWKNLQTEDQLTISNCLKAFRLMVSGSAALPVSVLETWKNISGHTLLERYGMTEIGMAVSNPYQGERRAGHIGQPLPGMALRLVDEQHRAVSEGQTGEIQVQGPNLFRAYWNKPDATKKAFTEDGWFRTGDMAVLNQGSYRILGRNSVDIIKSGGYKISALEIEEVLRTYPQIQDCGVVGIPDDEWGEKVVAAIILTEKPLDYAQLKNWLKEKLPAYQIPKQFMELDALPRNVLGKVTKNELKRLFNEKTR